MPKRLVDMLGYKTMHPFIGYGGLSRFPSQDNENLTDGSTADAMSPRRAANRMIEWLQKPLDNNAPAWAHEAEWASGASKL